MNINFQKVDQAHDDMSETLEYADSTKQEIRDMACGLCLALNELQEQRRQYEREYPYGVAKHSPERPIFTGCNLMSAEELNSDE